MAMTPAGNALPCKNPNCKSHGHSHPNCRCYADRPDVIMAEGGEVPFYCQGPHKSDCEYYAEGGEVQPLHKKGASALKDAIQLGLLKGQNDLGDSILGHKDPTAAIASATAYGGAPSLLKLTSNSLYSPKTAQRPKTMQDRSERLLEGLGAASNPGSIKDLESSIEHPWFRKGANLHTQLPEMIANPKETDLNPVVMGLAGRDVHSSAHPFLGATAMKLLSQEATPEEMEHGISYAEHIGKGSHKIDKAVKHIFGGEFTHLPKEENERLRKKLHDYIEKGKLQDEIQESQVTEGADPISKHFPEHNVMLQATKGRVVNYLNSLKPQLQAQLPFDHPRPQDAQTRAYNQALDVANHPLSVLSNVKNGTLVPKQVTHLKTMYPEVYQHLSQKLTEKLTEEQLKGTRVPFKTRQALSIFLGTPLDSTMTPMGIQRIQAVFANRKNAMQQQAQGAPKKSTKSLSKLAPESQTADQALAARKQTQR